MSLELVPTFGTRPPIIAINGGVVHVSVHDAEFLRRWREWRHIIAAAHPDRGGTNKSFRATLAKYRAWEWDEAKWYAQIGIFPPKVVSEAALSRGHKTIKLIEEPETAVCAYCRRVFQRRLPPKDGPCCSSSCGQRFRRYKSTQKTAEAA